MNQSSRLRPRGKPRCCGHGGRALGAHTLIVILLLIGIMAACAPAPLPATESATGALAQPDETATMEPPIATPEPPTATMEPPTATMEPPTLTTEPPTATMEPPTLTMEPPTATMEPPVETPTAVPADTPASQPPSETEPEAASPPQVSHSLAGREECLTCHAVETGMVPAPSDHEGRPEDICLFCHPAAEEVVPPPLPTEAEADFCLRCHGPFDELAARTAGAVTVEDVAANPHMYVPHDSANIFSCDNCHNVHPLPLSPEDEIAQANVEYCFLACHHEENFQPCSACHDDD